MNYQNIYFPKGKYIFNGQIESNISCNIVGDNAEIITNSTKGLSYMLILKDMETVNISGLKFNSNNIARGSISVENVENVNVKNCEFTGYTNIYGYYQTDSLLHVINGKRVNIENCYLHDSGYELDVKALNRAITVEDSNLVEIRGCKFNKVNQAIVTQNNKSIVTNCTFDYVEDNNIYNFSNDVKGLRGELIVTNNYISNRFDEGIVTNGKVNLITNNIFDNVPHCIKITGSMDCMIVTNNIFQNVKNKENKHGVVIASRDENFKIVDCSFKNNTIDIPVQCSDNGQILHFPIVERLSFTDNVITYYAISYGRGIYMKQVENLIFTNITYRFYYSNFILQEITFF